MTIPHMLNDGIPKRIGEIIRTYLQFPENQSITAIDFNAKDGEFLQGLTQGAHQPLLYGATQDNYQYRRVKENFHRIFQSSYQAESKISHNAFSLMVLNEDINDKISEQIFNSVDQYTMPNFEEEIREQIEKEEKERVRIQAQLKEQIDFGALNEDNSEQEKTETEEERNARINKEVEDALMNKIRAWRLAMKEQQKSFGPFRWDSFLLQKAINHLKTGGILVYVTPKELIDETVAFKLVNQFEDIRILKLDTFSLERYGRTVILAKKRRKATREFRDVGSTIARTKERPYRLFGEARNITINEEEDPQGYERQVFRQQMDRMYGILSEQETPLYTVPSASEADVEEFRIGPITAKEALVVSQKSKLIETFQKTYAQTFINQNPMTPTPLHKGHIMLLLTSGFLNGYIGTGPDQHLVKGSATKEVREFSDTDDEGSIRIVEREYYNIGVKLLNAQGEFRQIM